MNVAVQQHMCVQVGAPVQHYFRRFSVPRVARNLEIDRRGKPFIPRHAILGTVARTFGSLQPILNVAVQQHMCGQVACPK